MPELGPEAEGALLSAGTKIRTYDSVISDSCKRFADFINAEQKFGRIQKILAKLDRVPGPNGGSVQPPDETGRDEARTRAAKSGRTRRA